MTTSHTEELTRLNATLINLTILASKTGGWTTNAKWLLKNMELYGIVVRQHLHDGGGYSMHIDDIRIDCYGSDKPRNKKQTIALLCKMLDALNERYHELLTDQIESEKNND